MDVLLVMELHDKQTGIQYAANIDYLKVRTILENLMNRDFFVKKDTVRNRNLYHLTEEGRELLNHIKTVKRQLKGIWNPQDKDTAKRITSQ